jgi:hypothetical protein
LEQKLTDPPLFLYCSPSFDEGIPLRFDGEIASRYPVSPPGKQADNLMEEETHFYEDDAYAFHDPGTPKLDPPDDEEPPRLTPRMSVSEEFEDLGAQQPVPPHPPHHYDNAQVSYDDEYDVPDPDDPMLSPEDGEPAIVARGFFHDEGGGAEYYPDENGGVEPGFEEEYHVPVEPADGVEEPVFEEEYYSEEQQYQNPPEELFVEEGEVQYEKEEQEYGGAVHYAPDDPFSPPQQQLGDAPQGHFPMPPPDDDGMCGGAEEKKFGMDEQDGVPNTIDYDKTGEEDFIPIMRDGYRLSEQSPTGRSIVSQASLDSQSQQSSALRGAQEILKKNRRKRVEM